MYSTQQSLQIGSELLAQRGFASPRLDCELILGHVLSLSREQLYAHDQKRLEPHEWRRFNQLLRSRLVDDKPLAHIIGRKAFYKNDFVVTEGVFIPRPETELLVEQAIHCAQHLASKSDLRVIDVCTGSGAVAISLMRELSQNRPTTVEATDISQAAIDCTAKNARTMLTANQQQTFVVTRSNLLQQTKIKRPHIIVSNPPYLSSEQMHALPREVRDHDPMLALYGGVDGLDAIRSLAVSAQEMLEPQGYLLLEVADDQSDAAATVLRQTFLTEPAVFRDLAGIPRVLSIKKLEATC